MIKAINFISAQRLTLLCMLVLTSICCVNSSFAEEIGSKGEHKGFDHFSTGFPLIGRHELAECSDCHRSGQFKGTPMECGACHDGARAPGKHPQHLASSNFCDSCHTERTWLGAKFDHINVQGECQSCHNNIIAVGKSPQHILSSVTCEDCHNTLSFKRVGRVDHASVIGACSSCHNGVIATGKNSDHIPTMEECNSCHTVFTWEGAEEK